MPATVILLLEPSQEELSSASKEAILLDYWRLLFHANLHISAGRADSYGRADLQMIRERIDQIGQAEFAEVRRVLGEDQSLLPPFSDDRA